MIGPPRVRSSPDAGDRVLVVVFLLGFYIDIALRLPGGIPLPNVLAGAAGCLLLLKNAGKVQERHAVALLAVIMLYLGFILLAPDDRLLVERIKGLIQITYSLVICYGFYLGAIRFDRAGLARILLLFCAAILVGAALENYTSFRAVSDAFRARVYDIGLYASDARDILYYGRVRPKLFTSEPAALNMAFAVLLFAWYVLARWRLKLAAYLACILAGYFLMRGPTLVFSVLLVPLYEALLVARRGPPGATRADAMRAALAVALAAALAAAAAYAAVTFFPDRLRAIASGQDASFFGRVVAPPLTALEIVEKHPVAGAGLAAWEYIDGTVQRVYDRTTQLELRVPFADARDAITNYFWLHWIWLGLAGGVVMLAALSWYLRLLGAPSVLFCWGVWAVFGQSSGAYVSPRTWIVLTIACVVSILHERERERGRASVHAVPGRAASRFSPHPAGAPR